MASSRHCPRGGSRRRAGPAQGLRPARRRGGSASDYQHAVRPLLNHQILHRRGPRHAGGRASSQLDEAGARVHSRVSSPRSNRYRSRDSTGSTLPHSGLPRHDWVWMPGDQSREQMLAALRHLEPSRDIRASFQYSNLGYTVAGMVAERITGLSWEDFTRARIMMPLGMTHIGFSSEDLERAEDS